MKNIETTKEETNQDILQINIPIIIKKRTGRASIILPQIQFQDQKQSKKFDDKLLNVLAKACQWKEIIEDKDNNINSIADLAVMLLKFIALILSRQKSSKILLMAQHPEI